MMNAKHNVNNRIDNTTFGGIKMKNFFKPEDFEALIYGETLKTEVTCSDRSVHKFTSEQELK